MSTEFEREKRYLVFKLSDVEEHFTPGEKQQLARLAEVQRVGRSESGKPLLECVVVESDWPEYEPTWKAIETRVTGAQAQPAPSLASDDVSLISEGKTQPAQIVKDAIIDDLQSQFDTEGITEHDSGDALIRLSDAIAAVEDNFTQPAPSVLEGWPTEEMTTAFARVFNVRDQSGTFTPAFRAALAAAPKPEGE